MKYLPLDVKQQSINLEFCLKICFVFNFQYYLLKNLDEIGRVPSEIQKITKITKKCKVFPISSKQIKLYGKVMG